MTANIQHEVLDALLVALWQCETERGFEHVSAEVHAHVAAQEGEEPCAEFGSHPRGGHAARAAQGAAADAQPDRQVTVTLDTLDQWTEDALTQGISPATYVYSTLSAELGGDA